uniref:Uncharacterized protein n=1 Tax=Plectus sambesii TaxID=2011161 RepID=A0A914WAC8_9BILA
MSLLCLREASEQALAAAELQRKRSASDANVVLRRRDRNKESESSTVDEGDKKARKKLAKVRRRISWATVTPAIIQRRIDNHGVQGAFVDRVGERRRRETLSCPFRRSL